MKNIALILIIIILSSIFLGCIQPPASTPTPAPTPAPTPTPTVTVVPTTVPPTPTPAPVRTPAVYRSFLDNYFGFREVRAAAPNQTPSYENRTITINAGDTVIWENDTDNPEEPLTIISEQNLWSNASALLRWRFAKFNYTFSTPGVYGVYIKEHPRLVHQKIIVNP